MRRPSILVLLAACLCAVAVGAAHAQPASALGSVDLQVKQNVLLLGGYIDRHGALHGFVYPTKAQVKKGGGLVAPVWPVNPWTGKPISSGTGRGTYTYTPAADRHSYKLVAHFSKGSYTVTGGSPAWLATERAQAAADLTTAQDALSAARDTEAELGGRVIKGYVEEYALLHGSFAPSDDLITAQGVGVGTGFWPKNPYTGVEMTIGANPGDLSYSPDQDGIDYDLRVSRGATATAVLDGAIPQAIRTAFTHFKDELVKVDMLYLQASVDRYGADNNDIFPASLDSVFRSGYCFDYWPKNPWTNADMSEGTAWGDYTYSRTSPTGYQIAGHLSDGTDYVVDDYWAMRFVGMRDRFKDMNAQAGVQVLKDYIDEWQASHGGALPTPTQMEAGGALMSLHSWWPDCPWTGLPMAAGTSKGDFQYTDHGNGTYTLTVRETPFTDPIYGGAYPEYYTAQ